MNRSQRVGLNALYGIVGLIGAFLLYWGLTSIVTPGYDVSITVSWLDQLLLVAGRYIWIPAVGVLFLTVGISPVIAAGARKSRVAQILIVGIGILFLCFGGFFGLLSLSIFSLDSSTSLLCF
ncbi:hypothetical protein [Halocatena marina]|uniref:hypothetical protein n=1 Tax=Halocatena marina TaxID=2934937 RepID=UPI0020109B89|nr:hypothetical protein [Halocatena marina]